ncbi:glucose-1-phosphate adenylyltransferase [Janibacter sp. Soil728]|uniref:glucose-1-phosphate adenylyltransferase family protein n=1 Tax=Janibacter sp. Soil728 TaxID=1736393 RepID=UPI0007005A9F|nr:sugar phosphate nucleotidyltransferase [Janibacter sp. Soil728]KRE37776.1 glucose-1-phosphate adenylyltransferase [Janibacter sp. Soil728]
MHPVKTLAVILAGGKGSRLHGLTDDRVKPALRFAGTYRLIDVALSNLMSSGITDVWVVEQYLPHSLNDHLSNGRPWDLDRNRGGLQILAPFTGATGEGFAEGNSDSLWRHRERIASSGADVVLVLSSDHLYVARLEEVVADHVEAGADLTIVTTRTDGDASQHAVVLSDDDATVTDFAYKPDEPASDVVATEIFCFDAAELLLALERLHDELGELGDYGEDLVPWFVDNRRTRAHRFEGYWTDMGTLSSYWRAHMELLDGTGVALDDASRPIRSAQPQLVPARVAAGAVVADSLLSPGSQVAGTVQHSVIGPGVVIDRGAHLIDCVVLDDVHICSDVHLEGCIVVDGADLSRAVTLGTPSSVTLVDLDGRVSATDARP